jgi:hypothetical protein
VSLLNEREQIFIEEDTTLSADIIQKGIQIATIRPNANDKRWVLYAGKEIHTNYEKRFVRSGKVAFIFG